MSLHNELVGLSMDGGCFRSSTSDCIEASGASQAFGSEPILVYFSGFFERFRDLCFSGFSAIFLLDRSSITVYLLGQMKC
ncbi:uncharacterized protein LOC133777865 isoform X2 [Humulus lupulus]|uniref:uncharacterized protein LOC133777865 isoform X2 n=1 Tax=Humulus lupulus TaxID=3486 RepID=UPI002B405279|nr:uncharacterized protein LOC133777865 isoform X2 [Humulus lupulus]